MMNGRGFRSYQPMNMVHRTKQGAQIWLGDYMAASNVVVLRQKGIRSVLTSAAMLDVNYSKQLQINHKIINAFDMPSYKMTPHFEEAFRFIDQALKKGNILVHCAAGISRSTTFVLVFLMRSLKMSFQHALGYVRSKRTIINPNYGFQNQLKKYEIELRKSNPVTKEDQVVLNYDTFKEKQGNFQFLIGQKKKLLPAEQKLGIASFGVPRGSYMPSKGHGAPKTSHALRGKSLNYSTGQRLQMGGYKGNVSNISNMTRGLLAYKLQVPRMLTMKR